MRCWVTQLFHVGSRHKVTVSEVITRKLKLYLWKVFPHIIYISVYNCCEPCDFSTYLCVAMVTHVTLHDVLHQLSNAASGTVKGFARGTCLLPALVVYIEWTSVILHTLQCFPHNACDFAWYECVLSKECRITQHLWNKSTWGGKHKRSCFKAKRQRTSLKRLPYHLPCFLSCAKCDTS